MDECRTKSKNLEFQSTAVGAYTSQQLKEAFFGIESML
jgi:hypothetical protein